jgi:hypothetical protein
MGGGTADLLMADIFSFVNILFCMSMKFLVTAELGRESRVVSLCFALLGFGGFGSKVMTFGMIPDK